MDDIRKKILKKSGLDIGTAENIFKIYQIKNVDISDGELEERIQAARKRWMAGRNSADDLVAERSKRRLEKAEAYEKILRDPGLRRELYSYYNGGSSAEDGFAAGRGTGRGVAGGGIGGGAAGGTREGSRAGNKSGSWHGSGDGRRTGGRGSSTSNGGSGTYGGRNASAGDGSVPGTYGSRGVGGTSHTGAAGDGIHGGRRTGSGSHVGTGAGSGNYGGAGARSGNYRGAGAGTGAGGRPGNEPEAVRLAREFFSAAAMKGGIDADDIGFFAEYYDFRGSDRAAVREMLLREFGVSEGAGAGGGPAESTGTGAGSARAMGSTRTGAGSAGGTGVGIGTGAEPAEGTGPGTGSGRETVAGTVVGAGSAGSKEAGAGAGPAGGIGTGTGVEEPAGRTGTGSGEPGKGLLGRQVILKLGACQRIYREAAGSEDIRTRFPGIEKGLYEFLGLDRVTTAYELRSMLTEKGRQAYALRQERGTQYLPLVDLFNGLGELASYKEASANVQGIKLLLRYPALTPYMYVFGKSSMTAEGWKALAVIAMRECGFRSEGEFAVGYYLQERELFGLEDAAISGLVDAVSGRGGGKKSSGSAGRRSGLGGIADKWRSGREERYRRYRDITDEEDADGHIEDADTEGNGGWSDGGYLDDDYDEQDDTRDEEDYDDGTDEDGMRAGTRTLRLLLFWPVYAAWLIFRAAGLIVSSFRLLAVPAGIAVLIWLNVVLPGTQTALYGINILSLLSLSDRREWYTGVLGISAEVSSAGGLAATITGVVMILVVYVLPAVLVSVIMLMMAAGLKERLKLEEAEQSFSSILDKADKRTEELGAELEEGEYTVIVGTVILNLLLAMVTAVVIGACAYGVHSAGEAVGAVVTEALGGVFGSDKVLTDEDDKEYSGIGGYGEDWDGTLDNTDKDGSGSEIPDAEAFDQGAAGAEAPGMDASGADGGSDVGEASGGAFGTGGTDAQEQPEGPMDESGMRQEGGPSNRSQRH